MKLVMMMTMTTMIRVRLTIFTMKRSTTINTFSKEQKKLGDRKDKGDDPGK